VDISIKTNELEPNRDQTDLIAELHQLRTQLERAMVDAERYRKLREGRGEIAVRIYRGVAQEDWREFDIAAYLEELLPDEAVDALPEPEKK
jgi:hypothetical protein